MKHGDDWTSISNEMKLKNFREAIIEFLRIPLDDLDRSNS